MDKLLTQEALLKGGLWDNRQEIIKLKQAIRDIEEEIQLDICKLNEIQLEIENLKHQSE